MKISKIVMLGITIGCSLSAANAQGFDDKVLMKPIPHVSAYNNDDYSLVNVVRDDIGTVVVINYHTPYRDSGGWMNIDIDDCLTDKATGRKYPVVFSQGIPKAPERFHFTESGPVSMDIALIFPPLPDNVKAVDTGFGLYNLDISNIPVQHNATFQKFPSDIKNKDGKLELYSIAEQDGLLYLTFFYTSDSYNSQISINNSAVLSDTKTGKTYALKYSMGIPTSPDTMYAPNGKAAAFTLAFESPLKDNVTSFDFIDTPNSTCNISGIQLQ